MQINIRHETPEDYHKVEEVTREAFWNLYCLGCSEHWVVHNLRTHRDYIPELSFVIELNGEIVDSIFYSKSKVVKDDNTVHETITFGPVSILPRLHRQGLGRALIAHSIECAKALGYRAIIIGGYPYHYKTYGFCGAKKYEISLPDGNYYSGIMALPLYKGALDGIQGKLYFSDALEPDETGMDCYDRAFPRKEKQVQASQAEFEAAVSEIDMYDYSANID